MKKTYIAMLMAMVAFGSNAAIEDKGQMMMIGNAAPCDWTQWHAYCLDKIADGIYEVTTGLTAGELKFTDENGNYGTVFSTVGGQQIGTEGGTFPISSDGTDDRKFNITAEGLYTLTVNLNEETLTAEYKGELPARVYMNGDNSNFDSNKAFPVYAVADGVYVYQCFMAKDGGDGKTFKFIDNRGEWNAVNYWIPAEAQQDGDKTVVIPGNTYSAKTCNDTDGTLVDAFWRVKEDGYYRVTLNTNDNTVKIEMINAPKFDAGEVTSLHLLGLAAGSFDSNAPVEMEKEEEGVFSWTGPLDYGTEDGDPNHANKQFKFCTSTGDWDKVWYLVPAEARQDNDIITLSETTTMQNILYMRMKAVSRMDLSLVDAFWGMPAPVQEKPAYERAREAAPNYFIEANLKDMTLTMTRNTPDGVRSVDADDDTFEAFSLQGIRMNATSMSELPAGIYVVRTSAGTRKVTVK